MSLKSTISNLITSKPDIIQFAKDRKFEESWIINIENQKPTREQIDEYLVKDQYQLLIVEYIWNSKIDEKRFVLTIFMDNTCKLQNGNELIEICLDNFYNYASFDSLINAVNVEIIGKEYLFNTPIEAINLGIFNHWLSTNPIELWEIGQGYNKEEMIGKIKNRPEIFSTNLNFQGLQFRFNISKESEGPYYGFKTPCCSKLDDSWEINLDTVDYWIGQMLRIK